MRNRFASTLALIAVPLAGGAGAQGVKAPSEVVPFPLESALGVRTPSQIDRPALSPDGRYFAYSIAEGGVRLPADGEPGAGVPESLRGFRLYVVDTSNGELDWTSSASATAWAASWSPDGRTVAFYSDEGGTVGLWVHRVGDAFAARLGESVIGAFHHMRPEWMPDGTSILVPVLERSVEPEARAPSPIPSAGPPEAPGVVVRTTGAERAAGSDRAESPHAVDVEPAPATQPLVAGAPAALMAVKVADGSVTSILPAGDRPSFMAARVSPSGAFVACEQSLRATFQGGLKVLIDLSIVSVSDRATVHQIEGIELDVNIDPNSPTLVAMAWSPAQDVFAYLHAGKLDVLDFTGERMRLRELEVGQELAGANRIRFSPDGSSLLVSALAPEASVEDPYLARLVTMPLDGAPTRDLLPPPGVRLRSAISANWRTVWQPDRNSILAFGTDTASGTTVYVRMPLDGSPASIVRTVEGSLRVAAATDRGNAVALIENAGTAPDYFLLDPELTPGRRLSRAEPALEGVAIGPIESFTTEIEANGERRNVQALIALPPGGKRGDRFPTIVTLYPGMELSRQARSFGGGEVATIPTAIFTTRGYAVLVLDVPLAPFGVPSNPLRDIQSAVLPQLAHAIELGYVDGERVGVMGHSYGGYGATCLACGTHAFRAVVAVSGSYDLAGVYATRRRDEPETDGTPLNMEYMERHQGRMGRSLWEDPQRYVDNSPYFQADEIEAPLLLLHGRVDTTCTVDEAEKLFNARKRLGGTAQLAIYEGEGHVPDEWSRKNRLDMVARTLTFFERHLRKP